MRRRTVLAAFAGTALAGCTGSGPTSSSTPATTDTPTPTPTPEPTTTTETTTPTPTPEPRPEIEYVNLVSEWESYGDAVKNHIGEVAVGDVATIAFRYLTMIHDGTSHVTEQVRVFDSVGDRVGIKQSEDDQLVDVSGETAFEHAFSFDTSEWSAEEHEAEVIVRDEITGKISEPETTTFDVVKG